MVLVRARLGHVGDLGAGELSILSAVGVGDNRSFGDFVLPQRKVRRTRVVDVEVRVHVVFTVDSEQVRRGRHAVGGEVSVTAGSVDNDARRGIGDVGDVATGARELRHFFLSKCSVVARLRVNKRRRSGNFHGFGALRDREVDLDGGSLTDFHLYPLRHFRKTGLLHQDFIMPRLQQAKAESSIGICRRRSARTRVRTFQLYRRAGDNSVARIDNCACDVARGQGLTKHGDRRQG